MSRVMVLTKYFLNSSYEEMFSGGKKIKAPVMMILSILSVLLLSVPLAMIAYFAYAPLEKYNQEGMIITFILFISIVISLFFGMYTVMNIFYFSNDIEQVLPLPFRSEDIVFAKFMTVMLNMLMYSGILILPLIAFGLVSGASPIYYLYMILVIIITPIFPMIIATTISILLMRFTNFSKHKDGFKVISGCAALILVVLFNFVSNSSNGNDTSAVVNMLLEGNNSLIGKLSGIFVTNRFSSLALVNSSSINGLINILIALGISIVLFAVFYIIAGKLYLKSIIGISESYSKRENILKTKKNIVKYNSPVKALVIKDIKIVLRTPQFFINSVAMSIYMPLIFGVIIFSQGNKELFQSALGDWKYAEIIMVVLFGAISLFISSGGAGTSAISREGKDIIVSKYIPVSSKDQLNAKIISSTCINALSTLILLIALIVFKANYMIIILGTIISMATTLTITLFGMYIDFKSPKLDWEDEKSLMKNNFTPLLIMLIMMAVSIVLLILSLTLFSNGIVMFLIIMLVNASASFLFYNKLVVLAENIYNEA